MSTSNPGVSAHTKEQWEAIRPVFKKIYVDNQLSLPKVREILRVSHGFEASEDAFKKRIERWPECRKNKKRGADPTSVESADLSTSIVTLEITTPNQTESLPKRTKLEKTYPEYSDYPSYIGIKIASQSESTTLHESIALTCIYTKAYTHRFFNAKPGQRFDPQTEQVAGWMKWYRALIFCQEISLLPRKKKDIITMEGSRKTIKDGGKEKLSAIVKGLLTRHLPKILEGIEDMATPKDLPTFWSICRTLHGLSYQLSKSEGENSVLMRLFIGILQQKFIHKENGCLYQMNQALVHLLGVPPSKTQDDRVQKARERDNQKKDKSQPFDKELHDKKQRENNKKQLEERHEKKKRENKMRDACRIISLCSIQALSSRLVHHHPLILQAWADHYQHWEDIDLNEEMYLSQCQKAFKEIQINLDKSNGMLYKEITIFVLIHYSHVAHYVLHDRVLAQELATLLWSRTGALLVNTERPVSCSVYVQGMVESIKIQALLCHITHEDNLKSHEQLKKKKHQLGLYSKATRRRYRKEVIESRGKTVILGSLGPYNLEAQNKWGLHEVVEKMMTIEQEDFQLFLTDLHYLLDCLWNIDTGVMMRLETAMSKLSSSDDIECQLLLAGLYDMVASLKQATSGDIGVVFARSRWLWNKSKETSLSEIDWYNLTKFLEGEMHTADSKGAEWRSKAKRLRILVVNSENV